MRHARLCETDSLAVARLTLRGCPYRPRRLATLALLGSLAQLLLTASAAAAAPRAVEPIDLSEHRAKTRVVDTVLKPALRARAALARTDRFLDASSRPFTISTDLEGVDLMPYAQVIAAIAHGEELRDVRFAATTMAQVGAVCGDPEAVACYQADDPERSYAGQIWFAYDDPDVVHTIVHEYGHHVDNQLLNLSHFGGACGFLGDGSRNWFFEREVEDNVLDGGASCDPDGGWEYLLGELYAEDFAALNGIRGWQLASFLPPTELQMDALASDIEQDFRPYALSWRPYVGRRRARYRTLALDQWSFATVTLRGPYGSDFDLWLYKKGATRWLARSVGRGRREQISRILPPGEYDVGVSAYRGRGSASVRVDVD